MCEHTPMNKTRAPATPARIPGTLKGKPWMAAFGKLRRLRKGTARIDRIIEKEFERLDPTRHCP